MGAGDNFRNVLKNMLERFGQTVIVYNNWGQPNQTSFEVQGLKNSEKDKPQNVVFQFKDRINIQVGSILQLKLGKDLWKVVDTEDFVIADTFVHFEARVVKILPNGKEIQTHSKGQAIFNAPVYGGVQVGGSQNVQSVSVNLLSDVSETVKKLIEAITNSTLPELKKGDAIEALNRLPELTNKPQTNEVLERVKTRLDLVKTTFDLAKDLAPIAGPLILVLYRLFGLN